MRHEYAILSLDSTLVAFLLSTTFSTLFFLLGYAIFTNPVPFGTMSFGTPCVWFTLRTTRQSLNGSCAARALLMTLLSTVRSHCTVMIYLLQIPKEHRKTKEDHIIIAKTFIPVIIWLMSLIGYSALMYVVLHPLSEIDSEGLQILGRTGVLIGFALIREALCDDRTFPISSLLGVRSRSLGIVRHPRPNCLVPQPCFAQPCFAHRLSLRFTRTALAAGLPRHVHRLHDV
jgi:hypothetical protein